MPDNSAVTGASGPIDQGQTTEERFGRSEQELAALRREIAVLKNSLADLQVQSARHAPLLDRAAFALSCARTIADKAKEPLRIAGTLANIPATAKRLSEALLRSERLVRDRDGRWTQKLDARGVSSQCEPGAWPVAAAYLQGQPEAASRAAAPAAYPPRHPQRLGRRIDAAHSRSPRLPRPPFRDESRHLGAAAAGAAPGA